MYSILVRLLFVLSAERAHSFTMQFMRLALLIPGVKQILQSVYKNEKPVNILGLTFKNSVGMAAGFDKNAEYLDILETLGFGYVEIGTVTPRPQDGNPKPRLFRLIQDKALINRMGFNNEGVDIIYERLRNRTTKIIIGGNIGKNKVTPNEEAVNDYAICFEKLYDVCDYFVINVSSPNTPGLRALQDKEELRKIITRLMSQREDFIHQGQIKKPLLLKIAPDLTREQLDDVIDIVHETKLDGLIATNTTISRENLTTSTSIVETLGAGGLSGAPLTHKSTEIIKYLCTKTTVPIMATGGVMTPQDAKDKIEAGANLIQVYTGFIYGGPGLVKKIVDEY
jgi:dihydroorotate dehydrogenase